MLKKAPWFWGTTPGSVRFVNNGIMLVDDKTGHQTWIGPGGITFSGPGESVSLRSEAPPRPQSGVRRMQIGMTHWGDSERAGLKIFIDRTTDEYLGDYEQTVEIGVEKDGTIQARGLDMSDPRSILRYKQHVFNGEANPASPAHNLAALFDEEARRREAHLEARITVLERKNT